MTTTLEEIRRLDREDPLGPMRARFDLPEGVVYLDGNSLGALPRATPARLEAVIRSEWGRGLIGSWNDAGWMEAPARVGAAIAPLIGARPHEVVAADSTSANLYKLIAAALRRQSPRRVVLSEAGGFPTDLYVAEGAAAFAGGGAQLRLVEAQGLAEALDETVAVLVLTEVHYKTGARHDLAALTRRAHAVGALTIWDLSHSTGAVPVDLGAAEADMAVGCGYKYLNGGPGAPAYLYVAERLQDELRSPLSGWMGHAAPFDFVDPYTPAPGIARFQCGTPAVLGLAALEVGVGLFAEVELEALFAKGQRLCTLFIDEVEARCAGLGLELATPRDPARRGSQVSFRHPQGYALMQALIARGVIGDFRAPDIVRFGFAPLYTAYEDAWRAAEVLHAVLGEAAWRDDRHRARRAVT